MKNQYAAPTLEVIGGPINCILVNSSDNFDGDNWGYSDVFKP